MNTSMNQTHMSNNGIRGTKIALAQGRTVYRALRGRRNSLSYAGLAKRVRATFRRSGFDKWYTESSW